MGMEFKGLEGMERDFKELSERIGLAVVVPAEDAAAAVFENAIRSADIPRKTGQLASSIVTIEAKRKNELVGTKSGRRGLYVGIEKKKGYYGYWLDVGWTTTGRKKLVSVSWHGAPAKLEWTRRRARPSSRGTHSQQGTTSGRKIPGTHWFTNAVQSAMAAAKRAYEDAFHDALRKIA